MKGDITEKHYSNEQVELVRGYFQVSGGENIIELYTMTRLFPEYFYEDELEIFYTRHKTMQDKINALLDYYDNDPVYALANGMIDEIDENERDNC